MSLGFSVYPKGNTKSGRIAFNETVDKDKPSISRCIGKIHPTVQATPGIIFYYSSRFSGSQLAILYCYSFVTIVSQVVFLKRQYTSFLEYANIITVAASSPLFKTSPIV